MNTRVCVWVYGSTKLQKLGASGASAGESDWVIGGNTFGRESVSWCICACAITVQSVLVSGESADAVQGTKDNREMVQVRKNAYVIGGGGGKKKLFG